MSITEFLGFLVIEAAGSVRRVGYWVCARLCSYSQSVYGTFSSFLVLLFFLFCLLLPSLWAFIHAVLCRQMRTHFVCATDQLKTNTRKLRVSGKYYYTWSLFGAPRASNVHIFICRQICSKQCILWCCMRVLLVFVCFPLLLFLQTSELISTIWLVGCWKTTNRGKEVPTELLLGDGTAEYAEWRNKGSYCFSSLPGESAPPVHLHLQCFCPFY